MKNIYRLSTIACALAGASLLVSSASASALDPADPYQYTAGQFPTLTQNYGLPPYLSGTESIGMRQARFANGNPQGGTVSAFNDGAVAIIEYTPQPAANAIENPAVGTAVAVNSAPNSPVMAAIRQSLDTIAATRGPVAETDGRDIASALANAPYDAHGLLAVYQVRVDTGTAAVNSLQARATQFAGNGGSNFGPAMQDVQNCRARLDQDFSAAQSATPQDWDQVRANLANDYRAYAQAVARAQSMTGGS